MLSTIDNSEAWFDGAIFFVDCRALIFLCAVPVFDLGKAHSDRARVLGALRKVPYDLNASFDRIAAHPTTIFMVRYFPTTPAWRDNGGYDTMDGYDAMDVDVRPTSPDRMDVSTISSAPAEQRLTGLAALYLID